MKSRNLRKNIGAMVRLSMSRGPNRVPDNTVSDNAVSDNTVSDNVVSDNTVSDDTVGGTVSSFVVSSTVRETVSNSTADSYCSFVNYSNYISETTSAHTSAASTTDGAGMLSDGGDTIGSCCSTSGSHCSFVDYISCYTILASRMPSDVDGPDSTTSTERMEGENNKRHSNLDRVPDLDEGSGARRVYKGMWRGRGESRKGGLGATLWLQPRC